MGLQTPGIHYLIITNHGKFPSNTVIYTAATCVSMHETTTADSADTVCTQSLSTLLSCLQPFQGILLLYTRCEGRPPMMHRSAHAPFHRGALFHQVYKCSKWLEQAADCVLS
jgi:hypothetical protein